MTSSPLLEVSGLALSYQVKQGEVRAVNDVSFRLDRGQSLGLVGESGCGKSSVATCLMRLLPDNARVVSGQVLLEGRDLLQLSDEEIRGFRWKRVAMVFQAAMNVLNPVYKVGSQIEEAIEAHGVAASPEEAKDKVAELFRKVGLAPELMESYPHEFSGGMRQRAVIAMALSCDPDLIIADEPTTALDVIVQDRILREMKAIQQETEMAVLYISHDIAAVAEVSDFVAVMYAGKLVEKGPTVDVLNSPVHPYTAGLMSAFPSVSGERRSLSALAGEPPNLISPPPGCPFHPRCPAATEICRSLSPPVASRQEHWAACWNPLNTAFASDGASL